MNTNKSKGSERAALRVHHAGNVFLRVAYEGGYRIFFFLKQTMIPIIKESRLFIGIAFFLYGILNFQSARYCDGNTADYYTCTRPSTYYYYDTITILLVIVGIFFIVAWLLSNKRR